MKLRKPLLVTLLCLLALLAAAGCGGGAEVPLKYDFEAGDTFTYDLGLTMNGRVDGPGVPPEQGSLPQDTTLEMRLTMTVQEVIDGVASITYSYDSLEMTADGQTVTTPEQSIPEITVKVDETGKVLSIEGLEQALPPGFSMSQLPFDPSQLAGQTNLVFPQGGFAKPGDTWEATSSYPLPGSSQVVESKATGKLVAVTEQDGRQVAEVEFAVDTPFDLTLDLGAMIKEMGLDQLMPGSPQPSDLQFELTMKGGQELEGVSHVDLAKGMPVDMDADLTMRLDMEVIGAPAQVVPEDQRGPFSMDIQAQLSLQQVK